MHDFTLDLEHCYDSYHHAIVYFNNHAIKRLCLVTLQITFIDTSRHAPMMIRCNHTGDILIGWCDWASVYHLYTNQGEKYTFVNKSCYIELAQKLLISNYPSDVNISGFGFLSFDTNIINMMETDFLSFSNGKTLFDDTQALGLFDFTSLTKINKLPFAVNHNVYIDYYDNVIVLYYDRNTIYNQNFQKLCEYHECEYREICGKHQIYFDDEKSVIEPLPYSIWSPINHKFYSRFHHEITTMMTLSTIVPYLNSMALELWSLIFSEL